MSKPKIIITLEGGIIQQILSDTDVEVTVLDWDIMECDLDEPEFFDDRIYTVDQYPVENFNELEAELREEWDDEMGNLFPDWEKEEETQTSSPD